MTLPQVTARGSWAAQRLKALREQTGLTQEQLAERSGIDRVTIVKLETVGKGHRKVTAYYASRLAPELGVTPDALEEREPAPVELATDPLSLLLELSATVAENAVTLTAVLARLEALERANEESQRAAEEP